MEFQHTFKDDKKEISKDILKLNENRLPLILILDGLTDIGNVGSIFRIADALKVEKVYIYNYSKEFNKKLLQRKSRSTIKYVPFEYVNNFDILIKLKNNYKFYVLDKTNKSIDYNKVNYTENVCVVIGSENYGVSQEL
ncbi:MAG: TrmH family RNA methyltransferase, partial [Chlorobi bacterium]|nr:TrmH family RNA methyltransferase [Chlorobiota bacterium]